MRKSIVYSKNQLGFLLPDRRTEETNYLISVYALFHARVIFEVEPLVDSDALPFLAAGRGSS